MKHTLLSRERREPGQVNCFPCFGLFDLHSNALAVAESTIIDLQTSFNTVFKPFDLSSDVGRGRRGRRRGRRRTSFDNVPCLQGWVAARCVRVETALGDDTVASGRETGVSADDSEVLVS